MLKAIVEIPKGSKYKYEIDKETGKLVLDRTILTKLPFNYGFIDETLYDDGDPLDCFIVSKDRLEPLSAVNVEVLGIIHCTDQGIKDDKLICKIKGDNFKVNLPSVENLISEYLMNYKKGIEIEGVGTEDAAFKTFFKSTLRYAYVEDNKQFQKSKKWFQFWKPSKLPMLNPESRY